MKARYEYDYVSVIVRLQSKIDMLEIDVMELNNEKDELSKLGRALQTVRDHERSTPFAYTSEQTSFCNGVASALRLSKEERDEFMKEVQG